MSILLDDFAPRPVLLADRRNPSRAAARRGLHRAAPGGSQPPAPPSDASDAAASAHRAAIDALAELDRVSTEAIACVLDRHATSAELLDAACGYADRRDAATSAAIEAIEAAASLAVEKPAGSIPAIVFDGVAYLVVSVVPSPGEWPSRGKTIVRVLV